MDFLHCNKCSLLMKTRQNLPFYLTNCKHVFCSKCCPRQICSTCQKPMKMCPIDKSMPESVRHLFSDVETLRKKVLECEDFQYDQKLLFCTLKHGEMMKNMEWEKKRKTAKKKLQEFQGMITKEKEVIRNLRSYLAISPKSQVRVLESSISPAPTDFSQHADAADTLTSFNSSGYGSALFNTFSSANNSRSMSGTQPQSRLSNKSTNFF